MGIMGRSLAMVLALAAYNTKHAVEGAFNIGRAITDITGPASEVRGRNAGRVAASAAAFC